MPIRDNFPPPGADYMGGQSDGWEYRTIFAGSTLEQTYEMIRQFLEEEGYEDVPVPATVEQLLLFKLPARNKQLLLFEDNGYVHNPVKILFPFETRKKNQLTLCLYNEEQENHLLRFHRIFERTGFKEK